MDDEEIKKLFPILGATGLGICEEPEDVLILQASYEGRSYADIVAHKITERLGENLENRGLSSEPRPKSGKGL